MCKTATIPRSVDARQNRSTSGCAGERPSKGAAHTKYARLPRPRIRSISPIDQSRSSKSRMVTGETRLVYGAKLSAR
jgi:hypothetical protein